MKRRIVIYVIFFCIFSILLFLLPRYKNIANNQNKTNSSNFNSLNEIISFYKDKIDQADIQEITYLNEISNENSKEFVNIVFLYLKVKYSQILNTSPMDNILELKKIADNNSNDFLANYFLGIFSIQTNQLDNAEKRLKKTEKNNPNFKNVYLHLHKFYKLTNNEILSKEYLDKYNKF